MEFAKGNIYVPLKPRNTLYKLLDLNGYDGYG